MKFREREKLISPLSPDDDNALRTFCMMPFSRFFMSATSLLSLLFMSWVSLAASFFPSDLTSS